MYQSLNFHTITRNGVAAISFRTFKTSNPFLTRHRISFLTVYLIWNVHHTVSPFLFRGNLSVFPFLFYKNYAAQTRPKSIYSCSSTKQNMLTQNSPKPLSLSLSKYRMLLIFICCHSSCIFLSIWVMVMEFRINPSALFRLKKWTRSIFISSIAFPNLR